MQILYFLLHYIYLTALVTLQIKFAHKTYEELIKYDVWYKLNYPTVCYGSNWGNWEKNFQWSFILIEIVFSPVFMT